MLSGKVMLAGSLLFISCFNLWTLVNHLLPRTAYIEHGRHDFEYQAHDIPMTLPLPDGELEPVWLTVEESSHFPLLGDQSDAHWSGLTTASFGYVRLGPEQRLFLVTMFHELHCLRVLNFAYGGSSMAPIEHVRHCLIYLREMALCAADTTLERGDFTLRDHEAEKEGATHVCRDWSTAYAVMEDNWREWESMNKD